MSTPIEHSAAAEAKRRVLIGKHAPIKPVVEAEWQAPKGMDPRLVSFVAPESLEAEQYRRLRFSIEQLKHSERGVAVGVCSPLPGDGKTITAINLAGSLAQDRKSRVLLVEVDLRRPAITLGKHFGLDNLSGNGLVQAVINPALKLEQVVRRIDALNVSILPAGECPRTPYEVLKAPRFTQLMAQACSEYDYLILDAPPVIPVPDCRLIAKNVDGFLMVVSANATSRASLGEALNLMSSATVLGIVFNQQERSQSPYSGYGYQHAYVRRNADRNIAR